MVQVYKEPISRGYHAPLCSCAALYFLAWLVALLLVPFFVAYDPYTFWIKTDSYREQPQVDDLHRLVVQVDGVDAAGDQFTAFFSSVASVNSKNAHNVRMATVKSRRTDLNDDGLADRYIINVLMPLGEGERVHSAKAMAFFYLTLQERAKLQTDALAYWQHDSAIPGRALQVDADMRMSQTWALNVGGGYSRPYADSPLLDPDAPSTIPANIFGSLVDAYRGRNVTLDLRDVYAVWEPMAPGGATEGQAFNMTLTARVDQQDVVYTPPVSEVVLGGWIQYLSMLFVVWLLLDRLNSFIFSYQILETRVTDPSYVAGKAG